MYTMGHLRARTKPKEQSEQENDHVMLWVVDKDNNKSSLAGVTFFSAASK